MSEYVYRCPVCGHEDTASTKGKHILCPNPHPSDPHDEDEPSPFIHVQMEATGERR
jgi:hypothetical protein